MDINQEGLLPSRTPGSPVVVVVLMIVFLLAVTKLVSSEEDTMEVTITINQPLPLLRQQRK